MMTAYMQLIMIHGHIFFKNAAPYIITEKIWYIHDTHLHILQVAIEVYCYNKDRNTLPLTMMQKHTFQMTSSATLLSTCTFAFTDLALGRMVTSP